MTHHDAQPQLFLLATGELAPSQRRELLDHVQSCPACKAELAGLRETYFLLQEAVDALPEQRLQPEDLAALATTSIPAGTGAWRRLGRSTAVATLAKFAAVIGICALLGGMLLPSLGKARQRPQAQAKPSSAPANREFAEPSEHQLDRLEQVVEECVPTITRAPVVARPKLREAPGPGADSKDAIVWPIETTGSTLDFQDMLQVKPRATQLKVSGLTGGRSAEGRQRAPHAASERKYDDVAGSGAPPLPTKELTAPHRNDQFFALDQDSLQINDPGLARSGANEQLQFDSSANEVKLDAVMEAAAEPRQRQVAAEPQPAAAALATLSDAEALHASPADSLAESRPVTKQVKSPLPVNPFVLTANDRYSTFALEAEAASYALTRRYLNSGYLPPPTSVRMEEFINAFDYNYPQQSQRTFAIHAEAAPAPFRRNLTLLKIGLKGKVLGRDGRKPSHLVFVIDASGSMAKPDRLPVVKHALNTLLDQLDSRDRVTLITYGTRARLICEALPASAKTQLASAIAALETGASTNLLGGLELGYSLAVRHFRPGEINRVILCSDGVANVGPSDADSLLARVVRYRDQGIALTTVGVGAGSYDDQMLEQLANHGNGNYVFIDSPAEAERIFAQQLAATLQMIAKDVKIQVEFNPEQVRRYRLIGYENRAVADQDFHNDAVDAGEIGSGQAATALYELELSATASAAGPAALLGTVSLRYHDIDTGQVQQISSSMPVTLVRPREPADAPRFFLAACAAEFAEILRHSEYATASSLTAIEAKLLAVANALPLDAQIQELLRLVQTAQGLPNAP